MSAIIKRSIGSYTHFLNCVNGQIVSFEIDSIEAEKIINRPTDYEFDHEAGKVFKNINGQYNSRLCRENLIKLGLEFKFPTMVNIELSRRCSLRCIHCYVGNKNLSSSEPSFFERMNESDIDEFLSELKNLGIFLVVITGGEPFISKRLQNFLRIATEKDFLIEIFSNLQNLPDWFLFNNYGNFRVGRIQTSVYSSVFKIHDRITKSVGSLKRNLKNLNLLVKMGYFVEVATPLMRKSIISWENTRFFFKEKKIAQNFSWPIANEYYGLNRKRKNVLNISGQNLGYFIEKNPDFLLEKENPESDEYICEAGKAIFSISATGDVFPCSQMPLSVGNITLKRKIKEIVYGEKMLKIGSLKWKDVSAKKVFNFCPGINYTDTGNMLTQSEHMLKVINAAYKKERR
ncbi:radical SAM protein [Candidatus Wolfebacteria bacterium]|nr:radical SAM protein [Candidatus Wolfebacteria bacterium]